MDISQKTHRRHTKRSKTSIDTDSDTSDSASTQHFVKYIVIQATDEQRPLTRLSPFWIHKSLSAAVGTLTSVKTLRSGSILVETSSKTYSNKLLSLSELAGVPVKAEPHRSLNTSKGVVRCAELKKCSRDEILENLKPQGVTDHYNISVRSDDGQRRNTNTHILTFNLPTPPKEIKIGYLNVRVDVYIPNPVRCFKCQRFGHTIKFCKNTQICPKCGESHTEEQCSNPLKCINCGGPHTAFNKDCPKWVLEKKVQQIRAEKGCSFPEARKLATTNAPSQSVKSCAAIVRTKITRAPTTADKSVQTYLTWPSSASQPSPITNTQAESQTTEPVSYAKSPQSSKTRGAGPSTRSPQIPRSSPDQSESRNKSGENTQKRKAPKLNRPPRHTENPVTMYNKYGALDTEEGIESEIETGIG